MITYNNHILFYRIEHWFSILNEDIRLEFLDFLRARSISRKYSHSLDLSRRIYLWFSSLRMRDLFVGVNLHSVCSFSIYRSVQSASRAIRKTRHPHLPMLAGCVVRLYRSSVKGADFSHPFLFDIPLFLREYSRRKNTQGSEKVRETENERERETNKKFPSI